MFVKICGITRAEDAALAVSLGAGAIGFVFWPASPRYLDPVRARAIVDLLPSFVTPVGVFVNQPVDHVNAVADAVRLQAVQLHGDETPAFAALVTRPIVRAVTHVAEADLWGPQVTLLVDGHDATRRGGTGTKADWAMAAGLARQRRVLLAGGLTPDNVGAAVEQVGPFGIDVSSGVESAPGIKDYGRLAALFKALHESHQSSRS